MADVSKLAKFSWGVLFYNVLVIVFGAFVRATGSGAGCGSHWPMCNGVLVPRAPAIETIIEFTHRIMSAVTILLIIALVMWVWRKYPKGSLQRWMSGTVVLFIVVESLLGASLVLFNLVLQNASVIRAVSMIIHLINTFILLASLTLNAWFVTFGAPLGVEKGRSVRWIVALGAVGLIVLGASGGMAALGDTLFPSSSLLEGFQQDFDVAANYLVRLRIFHPLIAILTGGFAAGIGLWLRKRTPGLAMNRITSTLVGLIVFQWVLGAINVVLLAPVWIQLLHLFLTSTIWILYLLAGVLGLVSSNFAGSVVEQHIHEQIHQPAP